MAGLYSRRTIRLRGYDYTQAGWYFVTICIQGNVDRCGVLEEQMVRLNDIGQMIKQEWCRIPERFSGVSIDEYIVMPDHFHGIIRILSDELDDHCVRQKRNPGRTQGPTLRDEKRSERVVQSGGCDCREDALIGEDTYCANVSVGSGLVSDLCVEPSGELSDSDANMSVGSGLVSDLNANHSSCTFDREPNMPARSGLVSDLYTEPFGELSDLDANVSVGSGLVSDLCTENFGELSDVDANVSVGSGLVADLCVEPSGELSDLDANVSVGSGLVSDLNANHSSCTFDREPNMPVGSGLVSDLCTENFRGLSDSDANMPNLDSHHSRNIIGDKHDVANRRVSLSDVMCAFKSITTHRYIRGVMEDDWPPFTKRLWQKTFYDRIIRDEIELENVRQYIRENPLRG